MTEPTSIQKPPSPTTRSARSAARRQLVVLFLGIGAVVLATVAGGNDAIGTVLEPPFPVGLLLGVAVGIIGVVALLAGAARIRPANEDPRELIRGVRLAFVAVGCFAAAAGWILGSGLPIIAGLIIIGIDVIETTFLLLLTAAKPVEGADEGADAPEDRSRI
jgi:hypothetical protein